MSNKIPPLSEFIDLARRAAEARAAHGLKAMTGVVKVAVYNQASGTQALTIRISEDLAEQYGLVEGARMACYIHPDQQHIALTPGDGKRGASLYRPPGGRALMHQTTLSGGTLEPRPSTPAKAEQRDGALVITLSG